MSDYASAVDRARRAFASVARLEAAFARDPQSASIQINLAAQRKLARQAEEYLFEFAKTQHIEVCNYRLMPEGEEVYALTHVSKSMLEYQNLFSQIYDALKHGGKQRAVFGVETARESVLEFGYSYGGSLGVVFFAPSRRDFFEGRLDNAIETLFKILEIADQGDVRAVADSFGRAVVKRAHDWSKSTTAGTFSVDLQWNRSDGRRLGQVIDRARMARIVDTIVATTDVSREEHVLDGMLIGINVRAGAFQFIDEHSNSYRGRLHESFPREEVGVPRKYRARILERRTTHYSEDDPDREWFLKGLSQSDEPA